MPTPHVIVPMGCIKPWLLAHGCVLWQGSLPPLTHVWSPCLTQPCFYDGTIPYLILSWCSNESWPCTLVRSILHHVLSQLCCCYIPMLHLSNKPWHCTHGSSSRLTQGIVPLCHCREGSSHHASCHCHHEFPTTICRGAHVWVPIRLALCVLLGLEALHQGPLVWPCPCHLEAVTPPPPLPTHSYRAFWTILNVYDISGGDITYAWGTIMDLLNN